MTRGLTLKELRRLKPGTIVLDVAQRAWRITSDETMTPVPLDVLEWSEMVHRLCSPLVLADAATTEATPSLFDQAVAV